MYKITHKQKLDLKIIETWASDASEVLHKDWNVLSAYLGWTFDNNEDYQYDTGVKFCIHDSYTEQERIIFNKVRKMYLEAKNDE